MGRQTRPKLRVMIHVLLVEDQPIYRNGLRAVLDLDEQIEVAGEAANGQEALKLLETIVVDIILLDINMPIMGGLETLSHLQKNWPKIGVIMLTIFDEVKLVRKFLDMDVDGYILKEAQGREIREAIKIVAGGGTYYGREVMKAMSQHLRERIRTPIPKTQLTARELEILHLIVDEFTAPEIADRLHISLETVSSHRKNIREKLQVRNTAGIVREALRRGLTQ